MTKARELPTQKRLLELFDINFKTGSMKWKDSGNTYAGKEAGYFHLSTGRRIMRVDGRKYLKSRLLYKAASGIDPPDDVDHINRDATDDRLANLRSATHAENMKNQGMNSNNTSGYNGVSPAGPNARGKPWKASAIHEGKSVHLGTFDCKHEAGRVAKEYRDSLGYDNTHGQDEEKTDET